MQTTRKIRVLVVDDSMISREILSRGLSTDPGIEVVAKASDPYEARDLIIKFNPDVMTCDVEMPKMNGIDFVRRLLPQYPLPVIIVSTISDAVFDALNAGAVDFVTKPDVQSPSSVESFIIDLIGKIKIASKSKVRNTAPGPLTVFHKTIKEDLPADAIKVIAIGASTGGTEAIFSLLKNLPVNIPGIVIVQHIPPVFSRMFSERLNNQTLFEVKEAQPGDCVEPGHVLISPGDRHMRLIKSGGKLKVDLFEGNKVNGHCPSVDILFESAAKEAGNEAIGVILTGMGYDGAKGLLAMKRRGAKTIGQDEHSSVVYGMPRAAFDIGAVDTQAALQNIPKLIYSLLNK